MKPLYALLIALVPASLAAATDSRPPTKPAARPVGAPVNCLQIGQYTETKIRNDWTIDFIGGGGKVWRNTLPHSCPGLRSANAFTYETSLSQLCNVDIVYALDNVGGRYQRGAGCGLGRFQPVRLAK